MGKSWNLRMGGIHLGSDETPHSLIQVDDTPFRILSWAISAAAAVVGSAPPPSPTATC